MAKLAAHPTGGASRPPTRHATPPPDPPRHLASPEPRTSLTSPLPTTCWPRRRGHSAAAPQREHKVQHGAALDVVIRRFLVVGHLLAAEDETLLRRGDALLLLNPLLNPGDRFVALDVDLDFLAGQRLDLDLHGCRRTAAPAEPRRPLSTGTTRRTMADAPLPPKRELEKEEKHGKHERKAHKHGGEKHGKHERKDRSRSRSPEVGKSHKRHKEHREKRHHKEKRKDMPDADAAATAAGPEEEWPVPAVSPPGGVVLRASDYFQRANEFRVWLLEEQSIYHCELPTEQGRKLFKLFGSQWNAGKLAGRYYAPGGIPETQLAAAQRTRHKWAFADKLNDAEKLKLESMKDTVDTQRAATTATSGNRWLPMGQVASLRAAARPRTTADCGAYAADCDRPWTYVHERHGCDR
eukprot:CAMPEP_0179896494 /NCGR_PEP_ID=MMETSP0982-20121206/36447_1 /TAXON_ID=483367 /ORGANISM="non described non described, Strain CCMP 2436" /LENGTH=408 /DNA_ID=CAMNT_0021793351 /DNA_START=262 /DNA_END=1489 /DNA_ORIENTATION=+